ncbi:DNA polymerase III subunit alpha [Caldinitratiruptor microaerophilus]|uniref:DNA-directed DNA polymerase n=1 Tax=Caldinitratiruptor microaerophilus TaxID=671077 RepID=A0AA35G7U4_9FIRM|nr:DNA polymerase III subunit alpha [Caldinitratiruptor microaerophilus]BDG60426.1 DNA-directed DNA polymerase [Caldinitratiruptor microaerophilus]
MQGFVHLHCHSPFSFLDGASRIGALIEEAAALGMPAIALTDHDNVSGAVEWQRRAQAAGIRPIQGAELTLEGGHHLTLLATGPEGYRNLNRLLTAAHLGYVPGPGTGLPHRPPDWDERRRSPRCPMEYLERYSSGLIALSGCRRGEIPSLILRGRLAEAEAAARRYLAIFGRGNFYLELQATRLPGDRALHGALRDLGEHLGIPLVATANVHYRLREEFPVHDLLTCVRTRTRLDEVHPERRLNAENYLKPPAEMIAAFRDYPGATANTLAIAERCEPVLDLGRRRHPAFPVPGGKPAMQYLRELTYAGARRRYGRVEGEVAARLEHELGIIERLGFADYFLLVWDVCRHAREEGIRYAGRGSAADSVVAYCLEITDVDALRRGLLFERFLSTERAETPDIDVDFDARHRDRVAAYVFERYGADRVAAVATYNTFQARSAVRDLGKAMGLPAGTVDRLARRLPLFAGAGDIERVAACLPELRRSGIPWERLGALVKAAAAVAGLPRHLGTHLGGLVISREPLVAVSPLGWAAKGVPVVQFDKRDVEDLGLIKLDLLSLRTLSAVEDALGHLERAGRPLDYERLPLDDPETYRMLRAGDTVGVFQLESPAQRALQARLGAEHLEDIVASVAIIRPGPIKGNMVEPFLARRHGREPVTYLHPSLEPILRKTYGVVLFQEQVIEIAAAVAGFTPGEADQLRRVMTHARDREEMRTIGQRFVEKAVARGVDPAVAETIFSYIRGYASYGFCEAHAAAFATTAYKTAYLVRHHPAEFFAAVLTNQPMGYYPPRVIVEEAKRRGVAVLPPDVNRSRWEWTVEAWPESPAGAMRCGLGQVRGLSRAVADAVIREREAGGPYRSLADLCARTPAPRDELEALILAGALDSLNPNRRRLLWELPGTLAAARAAGGGRLPLPGVPPGGTAAAVPDFSPWERFVKEYEVLDVMIGRHAMALHRPRLEARGYRTAAAVRSLETGTPVRVAGLAIRPHRPPTRSGRITVFLSLEDETGFVDVTVWEDVYLRYGHVIFQEPIPPLAVQGRVERRGQGVSVIASQVWELET